MKTFQILTETYGDETLSRAYMFEWYKRSSRGRVSVEDDEPTGHPSLHAEIVEVEIEVVSPSIVPSGNFVELKSYCHLYGARGQRQAYLLPMPR
ncbi:hypothetical protein TNCV_4519291 [Trichonephila clavipes]|nr:hypothetical protein TNCV_4519291 [Trichonephila clavipes]